MPDDSHHHHHADAQYCPSCDFGPFTRNAYWTGKLMLARDFVDEQKYVIEKLRHHNQTLHGFGIVCGLKVVQHPKEACRDRFVCVEPGTAVDCCGHDIAVREMDCIDLWSIPELKKLKDANDDKAHVLKICIKYRECESEPIPKLYDECGCDEETCAPNRVLESYELRVLVDPKEPERPEFPAQCRDLWMTSLKECPHCDQPDCLILATIREYHVNALIVDADLTPLPAKAVKIDNSTRTILPSVQLVKQVIDCILNQGPGGGGGGGGGGGAGGPGLDDVHLKIVPCGAPEVAQIVMIGSQRVLQLEIPTNCGVKLTHICGINWNHAEKTPLVEQLLVAFDGPIEAKDINLNTFIVERGDRDDRTGLICWCQLDGEFFFDQLRIQCVLDSGVAGATTTPDLVGFRPRGPGFESDKQYRVIIKGDLIRDAAGAAVDANHLPKWLPARKTGDGIEGGTFESWFVIERQG